jgi:hypothetical protein
VLPPVPNTRLQCNLVRHLLLQLLFSYRCILMYQHPLIRRDTRVRFSVDHGGPQASNNSPDDANYQPATFPVLQPEPAHISRTHDPPPTHSQRATWAQPGPISPPQGYIQNPHFNAQWSGHGQEASPVPSARPMPPGSRFNFDDAGETGPIESLSSPSGAMHSDGYFSQPFKEHLATKRPQYRPDMLSGDTLQNEDVDEEQIKIADFSIESCSKQFAEHPVPPQNVLRSAMRRSYSEDFSAPTVTRVSSGSNLEAGGASRKQEGVFSNLMQSYGFAQRGRHVSEGTVSTGIDSRYQSQAVSRANSNESTGALLRLRRTRRRDSALSLGGDTLLDDDDPRVTGVKPNRLDDENKARETFKNSLKLNGMGDPTIVLNINSA